MFKIGVITQSFKMPLMQAIDYAKNLGVDGVQIYATCGELAPENITPTIIKEVKDKINSNNLVISALCGDFGGSGFTMEEENQDRIEKTKRIIDLALELNTNIITTHIGIIPEEKQSRQRKIMLNACEQISRYANDMGATFAIETGPEKAIILKEFLDEIQTGGIGVNMDPANLVMVAGDDPVQAVYTLKEYIVHTHAKDGIKLSKNGSPKSENQNNYLETPLGQGKVDFDGYLKALNDIGYHGFLTIEREVGDNPIQDIAMAVSFLKEKIQNINA